MLELIFSNTVSVIIAIFACSGFWQYMQNRKDKKDALVELVLSIAQDRITFLGMSYIERGYITQEEHANLLNMYTPYQAKGGNGSAKKVVDEVNKLPMYKTVRFGGDEDDDKQ